MTTKTGQLSHQCHRRTDRGDNGLRLGNGHVLRDGARRHSVQAAILYSGRDFRGFWRLLPDPGGLLLGWQAVLAAARLAILHAGGAGGHGHFGATHCTFNRA